MQMPLKMQAPTLPVAPFNYNKPKNCANEVNEKAECFCKIIYDIKGPWLCLCFSVGSSNSAPLQNVAYLNKAKERSRSAVRILQALPETAISVAVAGTIVGAAATFLLQRTKSPEVAEERAAPQKICNDCEGSGVCSECKGEGFVLKKMSDESADKARLMAKNMATRYTAGLPKKWSYCTKCSSARSCNTCGGSGKLSYQN